jgi:uncharacterized protein
MPCLIAIGGHTGTGKTTLAYKLRSYVPFLQESVVLEDDLIRRELLGLDLKAVMKPADYEPDISAQVEKLMEGKTIDAFSKHQSVINSSGFYSEASRDKVRRWADQYEAQFVGLWLTAPREVMESRIKLRLEERMNIDNLSLERGHASDACIGVIDKFGDIGTPTSPDWHIINAGFSESEVIAQCSGVLFCHQK